MSIKVEYIDHMGNDLRVVNSARVSFDKASQWEVGEQDHKGYYDLSLSHNDKKLIKYLATHNHWTPFSHVSITMRETVPIFVARERFRHTVGFTYNEVSRRYVDSPPEFFVPDAWRKRAENKKQGSSEEEVKLLQLGDKWVADVKTSYNNFLKTSESLYKSMIDSGVAPEQARMVLPQSMMTSYYVTGSLPAWARLYKLRAQPDAQKEIQILAEQIDDVISSISGLEHSWTALKT